MKSLFLLGYGLSIKVKDTRMVFSQGSSVFSERQEDEFSDMCIGSDLDSTQLFQK